MNRRHKKGSLLLEALLAVTILSVSIVLIIQSLGSSAKASAYNIHYTKAIMLLDNKIFELMRNPQEQLPSTDFGQFDSPYSNYKYQVETIDVQGIESDYLKQLSVNIFWPTENKKQQLNLSLLRFIPPDAND